MAFPNMFSHGFSYGFSMAFPYMYLSVDEI